MIQRSLNQNYRAAALVCAAVVFSTVSTVRVQAQGLTNLFGGTQSNAAATAAATLTVGGTRDSGVVALGSGYSGETTIPLGVVASVSETVNTSSFPNRYVLSATGATLGATFDANKSFAAAGLLPSTQYQFTVTSTNNASVNLFSSAGFTLSLNGTSFVNTNTGLGILGVANVLGILNGGGTTTFTFQTPANITPGSTVNFDVRGNLLGTVGVGTETLVLSNASITPAAGVPEPSTVASALIGLAGMAVWRARRRTLLLLA